LSDCSHEVRPYSEHRNLRRQSISVELDLVSLSPRIVDKKLVLLLRVEDAL
jgi:hypothetical protein